MRKLGNGGSTLHSFFSGLPPKTSRKTPYPYSQSNEGSQSLSQFEETKGDTYGYRPQRVKKSDEYQLLIIGAELGDGILPNFGAIKIACWNVNGIRAIARKNQPKDYLDKTDPHIICFNEMKVDQDEFNNAQVSKIFPKEYHYYVSLCRTKKGYSGVGVLSKTKPIRAYRGFGDIEIDDEGRTVALEFDQFFLVCVYVPSSGTSLERLKFRVEKWDPLFRNWLQEISLKKPVIWCGDANVVHKDIDLYAPPELERFPGYTEEEKEGFSKMLDLGFVDSFRELYPRKTHYTFFKGRACEKNNKGWRLDYFVVDRRLMHAVIDSKVAYGVEGSDHLPIELIIDMRKINYYEQEQKEHLAKMMRPFFQFGVPSHILNNN